MSPEKAYAKIASASMMVMARVSLGCTVRPRIAIPAETLVLRMVVMARRAARLQQHEHRARAAVVRARLTKRDHFRLLHEPRAHLALEHRLLADGAEPLAVNHAQAP